MKILLRSDVKGLGRRGDIVRVSAGHARNFLLPNDLAVVANDGTVVQAEAMRKAQELKAATDRESARNLATSLSTKVITISAKAGNEGRLFGSITSAEIVKAVFDQTGITIDRKQVQLEAPLRALGDHVVAVELFTEVSTNIAVNIVAK
jgi:large subunit ribosomal protein L9